MTISIELDPTTLAALRREAEALGLPVEEHAGRILRSRTEISTAVPATEEAFRAAMEATFRKNDELYRRLAK